MKLTAPRHVEYVVELEAAVVRRERAKQVHDGVAGRLVFGVCVHQKIHFCPCQLCCRSITSSTEKENFSPTFPSYRIVFFSVQILYTIQPQLHLQAIWETNCMAGSIRSPFLVNIGSIRPCHLHGLTAQAPQQRHNFFTHLSYICF